MTTHKHLKARVRARMARTGERYAAARAHVTTTAGAGTTPPAIADVGGIRHFSGVHPETTVLRILATHAGLQDEDGAPLGEEQMLAVGGGLGAGVFAFHYEKEAFSSLYLAGRHRWEDSRSFIDGALRRLGLEPTVHETGSLKAADRNLRDALAAGGPVAAWVDWVELGYRGGPAEWSGGAYHVLAVYAIEGDTAIVGDLSANPIEVPLEVLSRARARIVKHRNRLLTVAPATDEARLAGATRGIREGLNAGAERLATESRRNFSLQAFADLADRMTATTGATSWARVFPRGRLLWTGLSSLHRWIEASFTGGGLLRPMAARAAAATGGLTEVADRYAALGERWSQLADAALPEEVPLLDETRQLQDEIAAAFAEGGPDALVAIRGAWSELDELAQMAESDFPLTQAQTTDLLGDLAERLRAIHAEEIAALEVLRAATT